MSVAPASWSFDVRIWNMDELARQYTLVFVSRRMLRALAAATFAAAALLVGVAVVAPIAFVASGGRAGTWWALPAGVLLLVTGVALIIGLTMAYVRSLAALAAGSQRAVTILLVVVLTVALAVGFVDVLTAAKVPWFLRVLDPGSEYRTLEEMILLNLTYVGPVVAVADPSRDTPVGAARWRVRDDEWRQLVEEQIQAAALIVVGVAQTSGLRWEIETIRRTPGALDKTVFVCPPGASQNADVLAGLAAALGGDSLIGLRPEAHVLMARHSREGQAHLYVASTLTEPAYYVALRSCTLRPETP